MRMLIALLFVWNATASAEVFAHYGYKANNDGVSFEWYSEDPTGKTNRPAEAARVVTKKAQPNQIRLYEQSKANAQARVRKAEFKAQVTELLKKDSFTDEEKSRAIKMLLEKLAE